VRLLRLWALATGVLAAALAVWAWAPVVVFLVLLTAALGVLSAGMIALARGIRVWRERSLAPECRRDDSGGA